MVNAREYLDTSNNRLRFCTSLSEDLKMHRIQLMELRDASNSYTVWPPGCLCIASFAWKIENPQGPFCACYQWTFLTDSRKEETQFLCLHRHILMLSAALHHKREGLTSDCSWGSKQPAWLQDDNLYTLSHTNETDCPELVVKISKALKVKSSQGQKWLTEANIISQLSIFKLWLHLLFTIKSLLWNMGLPQLACMKVYQWCGDKQNISNILPCF